MLKFLLVSPDKNAFSGFELALAEYDDVDFAWADSGAKALVMAGESGPDLAVADEDLGDMTGLEFAGRLVSVNPMINCALISTLPPEDFHQNSEGLGVMAQLPAKPGKEEAKNLVRSLGQLKDIMVK